jgi:hypothetical protein
MSLKHCLIPLEDALNSAMLEAIVFRSFHDFMYIRSEGMQVEASRPNAQKHWAVVSRLGMLRVRLETMGVMWEPNSSS